MKKLQLLFIAFVLMISLFPSIHTEAAQFKDIEKNRSSANSINKLVELGIASGYTDQTFKPTKQITRAELAKMLTTIILSGGSSNIIKDQALQDVPKTHWAADSINFLVQNKVMTPTSGKKFEPNRVVTRGEFAQILAKAYKLKAPASHKINFTDVTKSSPYYEGVRALTYYKITSGTSKTTFSPNSPLTREQIAVFLDREGSLDKGLALMKKVDFSTYYSAGDKLLDTATFEKMITPIKKRGMTLFAVANSNLPFYELDFSTNKWGFSHLSVKDGEYFYILNYSGWGDDFSDQHLVKVKFQGKKFVGFKLYKESEVKTLKETIFKSDIALNEFIDKHNLYAPNVEVSFSGFTSYTKLKPTIKHYVHAAFPGPGKFQVNLFESSMVLEFNVTEKNGVQEYTVKALQPVAEIPYVNASPGIGYYAELNGEPVTPDFVKHYNNKLYFYNLDANPLQAGTVITVFGEPQKMFEFDGKTMVELPVE